MSKYVLAFCIISFGYSISRVVRTYTELALVQHFPISSFFVQEVYYRNGNISSEEFKEYLREHWMIFHRQKWIIHGLWPFHFRDQQLVYCVNTSGMTPIYNSDSLDQNFKQELKSEWPVLTLNETEDNLWLTQYNKYGSCVAENPLTYFLEAVRLLQEYDIEYILRTAGIIPGNTFPFYRIYTAVTHALGKQIYFKCLPTQNGKAQYLLEIRICFDTTHNLANCDHRFRMRPHMINQCNKKKPVIYPRAIRV